MSLLGTSSAYVSSDAYQNRMGWASSAMGVPRHTLASRVRVQGLGVHSGYESWVQCGPLPSDKRGIFFACVPSPNQNHDDLFFDPSTAWPASYQHTGSTQLATQLVHPTNPQHQVMMVEHLLSACYGLGITDLYVQVHGIEAPIGDGSALPYAQALQQGQIVPTPARAHNATWSDQWPMLTVTQTLRVGDQDRWLEIRPAAQPHTPTWTARVQLGHDVWQEHTFVWGKDDFMHDIAPARSFARLTDVQHAQNMGMMKGASSHTGFALDDHGNLAPGYTWRLPNECARHKILDMMGDFALLGRLLCADIISVKGGHTLNAQAVRKLAALYL